MSKSNILFLILIMPFSLSAQESICKLTISIGGNRQPAQATLQQSALDHCSKALISGDTIRFSDTLNVASSGNLLVAYQGSEKFRWRYPLYLMAGELIVKLNHTNGSADQLTVKGPKWSEDFSNKLEEPVRRYNDQINKLEKQLRQPGADTAVIKSKLNMATHDCFGVPRKYIQHNADSPLDIIALEFMGKGDPTVAQPARELADLFHSLSSQMQNSDAGKVYWAQLQTLLTKE